MRTSLRVYTLAILATLWSSCGSDLAEGQTSVVLTVKNSADAPVPVEIVIRALLNGVTIPMGTIAVASNTAPNSDGLMGDIVFLPPPVAPVPDGGSNNREFTFEAEGRAERREGAPAVSRGSVSFEFVSDRQKRVTLVLWPLASTKADAGARVPGADAGVNEMDAR
ncbi:MAG: hypothetical protein SGI86_14735 [Deltaproteobacteria bacterium]|nr:hypothetical protein [Deltaproteobacteria bacterium]